jgi:hypothetical protein
MADDDYTPITSRFSALANFRIRPVADRVSPVTEPAAAVPAAAPAAAHALPHDAPADLGPLLAFAGTFRGVGFNTIFRPDNTATPTPMPGPVGPGNQRDNVLELNLTEEVLSFSPNLGQIPNRGSDKQGDIILNGIPYLQSINDIANAPTPQGIHFEPGLWLHVPSTSIPKEPATLVRMASIPHGTTIVAQGNVIATVNGAFTGQSIAPVDITPFAGGDQTNKIRFKSQTAALKDTPRIPQDLAKFIAAGTITQKILDDPNELLRQHIAHQTITGATVVGISTNPAALLKDGPLTHAGKPDPVLSPKFGGGPANIAFLQGVASPPPTAQGPNAQSFQMDAVFWIETVVYDVAVPEIPSGLPAVQCEIACKPKLPVAPTFVASIPFQPGKKFAGGVVKVETTQIQYSQKVVLNFNGLGWPHISVATLVPADPIRIPANLLPLT